MKLFNAIATATTAVVGTLLITADSAYANGWIYSDRDSDNVALWVRPRGCSGTICTFETKLSNQTDFSSTLEVDCAGRKWRRIATKMDGKNQPENGRWRDVFPGSLLGSGVDDICR